MELHSEIPHELIAWPRLLPHDNENLVAERTHCRINRDRLTYLLYGKKLLHVFIEIIKEFANNEYFDLTSLWHINNQQRYMLSCARAEELVRIIRKNKWMKNHDYRSAFQLLCGEDSFIMLHVTMFLSSLNIMCNDEQRKMWIPLAENFEIIGAYAQTEIGHGSNVAGLQTTAVFDPETDEWVINTPNIQAVKWWAGGLAKSATHCILMARLITLGHDFGVHAFLLQIRDLDTHKKVSGVQLIHIGSKLGYNGVDNGGMILRGCRIPRKHLLAQFCCVDRNGNYKKQGNIKMLYSAMTYTRKQIILAVGFHLAKSVVISIRYSAVRKQFPKYMDDTNNKAAQESSIRVSLNKGTEFEQQVLCMKRCMQNLNLNVDNEFIENSILYKYPNECQVLDYTTQQYYLMPLLSATIGFICCGLYVEEQYNTFIDKVEKKDFSMLKEIHITTSALKAYMTKYVAEGIEICRKSCGGHGYMNASGLVLHLANFLPMATYEGDFTVLAIQTGRGLLNVLSKKFMTSATVPQNCGDTLRYIYNFDIRDEKNTMQEKYPDFTQNQVLDINWQIEAMERCCNTLLHWIGNAISKEISEGVDVLKALDNIKLDLQKITILHSNVLVMYSYKRLLLLIDQAGFMQEYLAIKTLSSIYALHFIESEYADFAMTKTIPYDAKIKLSKTLNFLLKEARIDAVGICDSLLIPDYLLNSVLGRFDGHADLAILDSTKNELENKKDISDTYYKYIQYILHPERKIQKMHHDKKEANL